MKFLTTSVAFLIGIIAFFVFNSMFQLSYWFLFIWCIAFSIIQFCGAYFIGLNFHLTSINSLNTTEKKVMLSFDDGPHKSNTAGVLEVLKKHHVKALFCVIGKNIQGNEIILQQLMADGHQIANHSYSHATWFDVWRTKKVIDDVSLAQTLIHNYQPNSKLFRPPYGVTNPNIAKALKLLGLQSIGWNIRSYDTSTTDVKKIKQSILQNINHKIEYFY